MLNVKDPVPDKIFLTQDDTQQFCSESNVQFYITRFNSLNTSKILSANDYRIKLSVQGNLNKLQQGIDYLESERKKVKLELNSYNNLYEVHQLLCLIFAFNLS